MNEKDETKSILLTIMIRKPAQQIIKVFHRICMRAMAENTVSMLFDIVIIF